MMVDCAGNLSPNDPLGFPFPKVIRMMRVPAREEAGRRRQETGRRRKRRKRRRNEIGMTVGFSGFFCRDLTIQFFFPFL